MAKEDYKVVSLSLHREKDKELIANLANERNATDAIRWVMTAYYKKQNEVTKKEKKV